MAMRALWAAAWPLVARAQRGCVVRALRFGGTQRRDDISFLNCHYRPLEQPPASMVAESIGRPHIAFERVHALMPADIHHLEEIGMKREAAPVKRPRKPKAD
jgi:hypothetical protein